MILTGTLGKPWRKDGGTAWAKRTQGIMQAIGRFAPSRELIQPRKETGDADGEIVNVIEASTGGAVTGEAQPRPSGSIKTVACMYRSALEWLRLSSRCSSVRETP